jgi:hypothetical protein
VPYRQPLNRWNVTEGSVLVLPAHATLFALIGTALLTMSPRRTSSHGFDAAKAILSWTGHSIHAWGICFLTLAVVELWVGARERRRTFTLLLVANCGILGGWGGMFLWQALTDPVVSFLGTILFAYAAWCHVASIRSLTRDRIIRPTSSPGHQR